MELRIKPFSRNLHPTRAVFIKGHSAKYWIGELQKMQIPLISIQCYEVCDTYGTLNGCVAVFSNEIPHETAQHQILQCVANAVFIPEYSTIYPEIADEEWKTVFKYKKYVMHPEMGFQELKTEINWADYLLLAQPQQKKLVKPLQSVKIPGVVKSIFLDLDEEDVLQELQENKAPDPDEKLPFNMEKLLKGNQRELEKYLKFLEQNPEKALQYAVPLDILNSSRGGRNGSFNFGSGKFSISKNNLFVQFFVIVILVIFGNFIFQNLQNKYEEQFPSKEALSNKSKYRADFLSEEKQIPYAKEELLEKFENKLAQKKISKPNYFRQLHYRELVLNDSLRKHFDEIFSDRAKNNIKENKDKYIREYLVSGKKPDRTEKIRLDHLVTVKKTRQIIDSLRKTYGYDALLMTRPILLELPYLLDSIMAASAEKMKDEDQKLKFDELSRSKYIFDSLRTVYKSRIAKETNEIYAANKNNVKQLHLKLNLAPKESENSKEKKIKKAIQDSLEYEYGYSKKAIEDNKENELMQENEKISYEISLTDAFLRALLIVFLAVGFIYLFKRNLNEPLLQIIKFSDDGQNLLAKTLALVVITVCIVYLLKPLLAEFGYNLYFWITAIIVFMLLLRLLNKNTNLFNTDDDKK